MSEAIAYIRPIVFPDSCLNVAMIFAGPWHSDLLDRRIELRWTVTLNYAERCVFMLNVAFNYAERRIEFCLNVPSILA